MKLQKSLISIYNLGDLTIPSLIDYNKSKSKKELIIHNKKDILTLFKEINIELKELYKRYPLINKIRKNLKKKSKKFVISKNFNIGNIVSFGANIEEKKNSYELIMLPFVGDKFAHIEFRYYPKSKKFKTHFNRLKVALKSGKVDFTQEIYNKNRRKYIKFKVNNEEHNSKFWYIIKLWAKN